MAKWVRIHLNSDSSAQTNAYVDIEQYGFVRVEYDSVTGIWHIKASTIDNSQTATLMGSWNSQAEASAALFALLQGADAGGFQ